MSKDMLIALGGGALSGIISLAFAAGIPGAMVAVYLTPLPLFLIGLALGVRSATVAGVSGATAATLVGGPISGVLFALLYALPAWMVVRLATIRWQVTDGSGVVKEEWTPAGTVLGVLAVFAAALFVLAYILASGQEGGLQGLIQSLLERIFAFLMPGVQDSEQVALLGSLSSLFPGYLGMSWVVMTIVNGSIALAVLNRMKAAVRPKSDFSELTLPDRMSWFLIAAATLALVGSLSEQVNLEYIGRNLVMILALPFFFVGLAVVHNLARLAPYPGVVLTVFYMVLLLSGGIALIMIAAGLIEQWVGIRRYFRTPDQGRV